MKHRTEQEMLAKEVADFMKDMYSRMLETQEIYLSDVSKMDTLHHKLARTFDLEPQGHIRNDGELQGMCWGDYVFKDDPKAYDNMKAEMDKKEK